jgi:hypothetical protein
MEKDGAWIKLQGFYFQVTLSRALIFLPQFYILFLPFSFIVVYFTKWFSIHFRANERLPARERNSCRYTLLSCTHLLCFSSLYKRQCRKNKGGTEFCLAYAVSVITDGEASTSKISTKHNKFTNKCYKAGSPLKYISSTTHFHSSWRWSCNLPERQFGEFPKICTSVCAFIIDFR